MNDRQAHPLGKVINFTDISMNRSRRSGVIFALEPAKDFLVETPAQSPGRQKRTSFRPKFCIWHHPSLRPKDLRGMYRMLSQVKPRTPWRLVKELEQPPAFGCFQSTYLSSREPPSSLSNSQPTSQHTQILFNPTTSKHGTIEAYHLARYLPSS